ncbi:MAG: precorrin-3B C(17)-methyltransferase [Candidatus Avoscillospira sp.]
MKKLYIIGLGPGGGADLTGRAAAALDASDIIVGYTVYIDLIRDAYPNKDLRSTPMRKETERCQMALELADGGKTVAMVCSGDPGVYGMAGLCYELSPQWPQVELEVIPGITAACGGAAVLGAPLMHDFCLVSLSDLMTPWEKIETRLRAAAQADFVLCLYNPSSHKRKDYLQKACDILLESKSPETPCGYVSQIGREGEDYTILNLSELRNAQVDMFTTVFIGNSQTQVIGGHLVTPRGYLQR